MSAGAPGFAGGVTGSSTGPARNCCGCWQSCSTPSRRLAQHRCQTGNTFPFLRAFEDNWQDIEAEVREVLKHREAVPLFHEVSPEQAAISKGQNWRTFILYGFGERLEKNCARAPVTARLLSAGAGHPDGLVLDHGAGLQDPAAQGCDDGHLENPPRAYHSERPGKLHNDGWRRGLCVGAGQRHSCSTTPTSTTSGTTQMKRG
jgi:hypothetical protein